MGRLVTQAVEPAQRAYRTAAGGKRKAADLAMPSAVFVDRKQQATVTGHDQPGRVDALHHLQRLWLDMPALAVKAVAIDPLAAALGVATDQQFVALRRSRHGNSTIDQ